MTFEIKILHLIYNTGHKMKGLESIKIIIFSDFN